MVIDGPIQIVCFLLLVALPFPDMVEIFRKLPSYEEDKLVVSFTTTIIVFRYVLRTFAACPIVRGIEGCC